MGKRPVRVLVVVFFLCSFMMCGCGGGDPARERERAPSEVTGSHLPDGIPVYPGAQQIALEGEAGFLEHGVSVKAYETDDSLSRVYGFYASELEESGFEAPGSMTIGNGSGFVFRVSKGGEEVAMINGAFEGGKTHIVIIGIQSR